MDNQRTCAELEHAPFTSSDATIPHPVQTQVPVLGNDTLSSNLSLSLPSTPQRTEPNTARRRRYVPRLTRPEASPSHSTKVVISYQHAAAKLQPPLTPPRQMSSNISRLRIPFSKSHLHSSASHAKEKPKVAQGQRSNEALHKKSNAVGPLTVQKQVSPRSRPETSKDWQLDDGSFNLQDLALVVSSDARDEDDAQEAAQHGVAIPAHENDAWRSMHFETRYPTLQSQARPDSDSDDCHSTHGVRLILPYTHDEAEEAHRSNVDAWLEAVVNADTKCAKKAAVDPQPARVQGIEMDLHEGDDESSPGIVTKLTTEFDASTEESSNKENMCPATPTRPSRYYSTLSSPAVRKPFRFQPTCKAIKPQPGSALAMQTISHHTSQGQLWRPPRRKKVCADDNIIQTAQHVASISSTRADPHDFTIHDENIEDALAKLSPSVECHRKDRRPKRERCISYWDTDVLTPDASGQMLNPACITPRHEQHSVDGNVEGAAAKV